MFLKLALESGYKAAEAFKSVEMDDKAMKDNMRKKLDKIRKQYGVREKPRQSPRKGIFLRQQYQGYYADGYGQAGPMPMINPQALMFGQGRWPCATHLWG